MSDLIHRIGLFGGLFAILHVVAHLTPVTGLLYHVGAAIVAGGLALKTKLD